MKKIQLLIIFFILFGVSLAITLNILLKSASENTRSNSYTNYVVKDGYVSYENKEFGYRYQYKNTLVREPKDSDSFHHILGGESIRNVGAQAPRVFITVYEQQLVGENTLEDWIDTVSTSVPEEITKNPDLRYVSGEFVTITPNEIAFLVNKDRYLNFPSPVLLFNNGKYLVQLSIYNIDPSEFFDILETFQIKFEGLYRGLGEKDLHLVKNYFNNNAKF